MKWHPDKLQESSQGLFKNWGTVLNSRISKYKISLHLVMSDSQLNLKNFKELTAASAPMSLRYSLV